MKSNVAKRTLAAAVLLGVAVPASAQNLPPEVGRDLARVFSPSVAQTIQAKTFGKIASQHVEENSTCLLPNVGWLKSITMPRDVFSDWHCFALTVLAIDHIPHTDASGAPQFYQNFGPHRASWAMAMFHLTMFEVTNAYLAQPRPSWIAKNHKDAPQARGDESAAIVSAAYHILLTMYPKFNQGQVGEEYINLSDAYGASLKPLEDKCNNGEACLDDIRDGVEFGRSVAATIVYMRGNDNSSKPEVAWGAGFAPNNWAPAPFQWQVDPVSQLTTALGAAWGGVTPFQIDPFVDTRQMVSDDLKLPPPPVLVDFATATPQAKLDFYNHHLDYGKITVSIPGEPDKLVDFQVIDHGGDPHHEQVRGQKVINPNTNEEELALVESNERNIEQLRQDYYKGIFWSYDGTAGICAPVRLYNQIADSLVRQNYHDIVPSGPDLEMNSGEEKNLAQSKLSAANLAYLYYVINTGMADAGIVAWHYKYYYQYFRPVTGINAFFSNSKPAPVDKVTSGNINTRRLEWNASWYPLGGQNTNSSRGFNPTPPFPAYPSGHSVFGGTFFRLLGGFFPDKEHQHIKFLSDELNGGQFLGQNVDAYGYTRCKPPVPAGQPANYGYDAKYCTDFQFQSFDEASEDNSLSRIRLGVHWRGDADNGKDLGERIAANICKKLKCSSGM